MAVVSALRRAGAASHQLWRRRRLLAWGLGCALLLPLAERSGLAETPQEYEVKAAFLFNFMKFVTWPSPALERSSNLVLCIYDHDPFGSLLDSVVQGRTVQDKELVVRRLHGESSVRGCHVLYISAADQPSLPSALSQAPRSNVLTVGETNDFLVRGGIINFVIEGNKVRFAINAEVAERSGLQISSQLLKLAANVVPSPSAGQP